LATISTSAALEEVNWRIVLSASVLAGLLSVLTSFAGLPEVEVKEENDNGNSETDKNDND
ncbi:MAG: holin, partial [Bacteroidaceae bacterium]|nr:holin [Bacteroidaceae bacterium]